MAQFDFSDFEVRARRDKNQHRVGLIGEEYLYNKLCTKSSGLVCMTQAS